MARRIIKITLITLFLFVLYVLIGAVAPFLQHPDVTPETASAIAAAQFYGTEESGERAAVISDNEEALAERIRLISHAQNRIVLSTFDFRSDTAGKQMLAALLDAADRGVQVQVMVDGMPALIQMEGNPFFYALSAHPNAEVRLYNPVRPWLPWRLMGRMHDKYLIVDQTAYILGGRNTYDYFLGGQESYKNHDWDILVYAQSAKTSLEQLDAYFDSVWDGGACIPFHDDPALLERGSVSRAEEELRQLYAEMSRTHPEWFEATDYAAFTHPTASIQLLSNPITPYAKEPVVCYAMTELMSQAEREVILHTPYIICNSWMLERLAGLCNEVDSVTLLTNSAANNGNLFGAMDYRAHRQELLETGLKVLEYDSGISYHGKCATVDDRLSMIGSFNFDMRSAYIDTELMVVVDSVPLNASLRLEMERYESEALQITPDGEVIPPEGHTPQELSLWEGLRYDLMRITLGWARFLM